MAAISTWKSSVIAAAPRWWPSMINSACVCCVNTATPPAVGSGNCPRVNATAAKPPLLTAQRELEEEAGLRAIEWLALGDLLTTPGFCDEVIQLFLARGLKAVPPRPEAHEFIERHWISWSTARQWALDGTLRDAKTVAGLLRAAALPALK